MQQDADVPLIVEDRGLRFGGAVLLVLAATTLHALLGEWADDVPFVAYYPAVLAATFFLGLGPGLLSATLGVVIAWYVFLPPMFSFRLADAASVSTLAVHCVVAFGLVALANLFRRQAVGLRTERNRNAALAQAERSRAAQVLHRLGNNLQLVSSYLRVHGEDLSDARARKLILEASLLASALGRGRQGAFVAGRDLVEMEPVLRHLCVGLTNDFDCFEVRTRVALSEEQATAVSLATLEMLRSAPEDSAPRVSLERHGAVVRLAISWLEIADAEPADRIGERMLQGTATQLRGTLSAQRSDGARVMRELTFEVPTADLASPALDLAPPAGRSG